jgi:hypothetical protein
LRLEELETRLAPYSATGNAWPNPQLITLSFMPDGTPISTSGTTVVGSNLFATFNAKFGSASAWQSQILKAAQAWAQQTNINFAVVADNGTPSGQGAYQQGDPGMGDIRIGGYNFGTSTLGWTDLPPPANNYSVAGDVAFNTAQAFNIGSTYDLFTVAAHEIGVALGLGYSNATPAAVMYPSYTGRKTGLASDDIAGIRSIYSGNNPRSPDSYNTGSSNGSFSAASDISSLIDPTALTALVQNLNLATASQAEFFTFTAPTGMGGTLTVNAQSSGLSLLAPRLTLYDSSQAQLATQSASATDYDGTTLSVSYSITAGQTYYIKVAGLNTTAFGTGNYALALGFSGVAAPTASAPNTQVLNGNPLRGGGGLADLPHHDNRFRHGDGFRDSVPLFAGITPDTGFSNTDAITNAQDISLDGSAPAGTTVNLYWQFASKDLGDGTYAFTATDLAGSVSPAGNPYQAVITTSADANGNWSFLALTLANGKPPSGLTETDASGNSVVLDGALTFQI